MEAWPGQYCINVTDIERTIKFYEALGLTNTSRTEIPQAHEAVMMDGGGKGGKIQLAEQVDNDGPIEFGNAFWKLYILTNDIEKIHQAAVDFGAEVMSEPSEARPLAGHGVVRQGPRRLPGRVRAAGSVARR